jgi:hypothetical protein
LSLQYLTSIPNLRFSHLSTVIINGYFFRLLSCDFIAAFGNDDCCIEHLIIVNYGSIKCVFPEILSLNSVHLRGFDIFAWKNVFPSLYSVTLSHCLLPSNFSCFQFIGELHLSGCPLSQIDFSNCFRCLNSFSLLSCSEITLIVNANIKNIVIDQNPFLHTISSIGNVDSLDISSCSLHSRVEGLVKANSVRLIALFILDDFSFLENVASKLVIDRCPRFVTKNYRSILKTLSDYEIINYGVA